MGEATCRVSGTLPLRLQAGYFATFVTRIVSPLTSPVIVTASPAAFLRSPLRPVSL